MTMISNRCDLLPVIDELIAKVNKIHLYDDCFKGSPFKQFNTVGYLPLKGIDICLTIKFPTIEHELAHILEIKPIRLSQNDFGITNDVTVYDWSNSRFFTAMSREIRVRAIQLHFLPKERITVDQVFCTSILANTIWGIVSRVRLPFGRFRNNKDLEDWAHTLHMQTYRRWSIDKIVHEWDKRSSIINDWVESK